MIWFRAAFGVRTRPRVAFFFCAKRWQESDAKTHRTPKDFVRNRTRPTSDSLRMSRALAESTHRFWRHDCLAHRLEHSAQIAVCRDDRGGVLLESDSHDVQAAEKGIKFLCVGRVEGSRINRSGFGVGFALSFERVLRRGGTDRGDIAFPLTADVRGLAAPLGTEPRCDLMSLTRHALDDFLRNGWVIFAALETLIEQFDSEIGNFLPGPFRNLFLNFAAPEFNVRDRAGQNRAAFFQFLVAQRFSTFGYSNNFDEIVGGDGRARFAAEDVIKA